MISKSNWHFCQVWFGNEAIEQVCLLSVNIGWALWLLCIVNYLSNLIWFWIVNFGEVLGEKQNKLSYSYVTVAVLLSQTARATERSKDSCTAPRWILIEVCLQKFCLKSFLKLVLPLLNIKEQNNITASDNKGAVIKFALLHNELSSRHYTIVKSACACAHAMHTVCLLCTTQQIKANHNIRKQIL